MRAETKITDKRTKKMAKNFHEQRPAKKQIDFETFCKFILKEKSSEPSGERIVYYVRDSKFYFLANCTNLILDIL